MKELFGLPGSEASADAGRAGVVTLEQLANIENRLSDLGFADDVTWSENAGPPESPDHFALEAIFVVCNSGMKNTVARAIFERVSVHVQHGGSAHAKFGHKGKSCAIDDIWRRREELFQSYMQADDKLAACEALPWIGRITKYHLAKNFGVDVAKPDVHLQRLADREGVTSQALCERLAKGCGYKARTVDVLLWRACAVGLFNSKTGAIRP